MNHEKKYCSNCAVTSSGGGGGGGWSGVDVAAPQEFVRTVHLTPQRQAAYEALDTLAVTHMPEYQNKTTTHTQTNASLSCEWARVWPRDRQRPNGSDVGFATPYPAIVMDAVNQCRSTPKAPSSDSQLRMRDLSTTRKCKMDCTFTPSASVSFQPVSYRDVWRTWLVPAQRSTAFLLLVFYDWHVLWKCVSVLECLHRFCQCHRGLLSVSLHHDR